MKNTDCYELDLVNENLAVGHSGGFAGISADFRVYLDAGYTMAVLSNYGGGAQPVSQKIQNLVGRKS
jgi:hypothetical protein